MCDLVVWKDGGLKTCIQSLANGKKRICVSAVDNSAFVARLSCETAYPLRLIRLIYEVKGAAWLCDEIYREQDCAETTRLMEKVILAYVPSSAFSNAHILDFGCGSGASTMNLAKLFPTAEILGTDIDDRFLEIARQRALHYGYTNLRFISSPDGSDLPRLGEKFDFIVLSAVYEHLLPNERRTLFPKLWSSLRPGGVMFIFGTPNRWWPVETHTTGLPLINYLPDSLAYLFVKRFSTKLGPQASWQDCLRRGIRGGSVAELVHIIKSSLGTAPQILLPNQVGIGNRIDLCWAGTEAGLFKRLALLLLRGIRAFTGVCLVPDLELAIRKRGNF